MNIVDSLEFSPYIDRPAQRAHGDMQFLLKLVEYIKRIASLAVELVDEDYHRSVSHTAHLHQLTCLLLHAFGHVNDYDYAVDRSQCTICVLGKILVTRSVKNIDLVAVIFKSHNGSGH